jgi:AcrR family transcriptional regulator
VPNCAQAPSKRRDALLELAYRYVLEHGLADVSLRPLAAAVGSSPRVLLYLFGSKAGLVRALLSRARSDELALLDHLSCSGADDLATVAAELWRWLSAKEHRALLILWVEGYGRSIADTEGPWADFARSTVEAWLELLASTQPEHERDTPFGRAKRTLVLAVLRGALLDLLATNDARRVTAAVRQQLDALTDNG